MDYIDIINDKKTNDMYLEIKNKSNFYMDHAIKHRNNVINYCKKLIGLFNIDEKIANNILIAAALHDIGRAEKKENIDHAELSSNFARKYLLNKLAKEDIDFICELISMHSGFKDRTFYQEILYFADKMDFTKDRLEDNYQEKYGFFSVLESLKNITFEISNETFIVRFETDKTISISDLAKERKKYDIGIKYNISSLATMKNLKYKVYWDENIIFEGNKKIELV